MKNKGTAKGDYSFEEQNSLGEDQEERNQISINEESMKGSFAAGQQLQIQKVEAITLSGFIEGIKLKLRPQDYVPKKNDENLRLDEHVFIFKVQMNEQEWKVRKRFSDFQVLDKQIRKIAEDIGVTETQLYPIPKTESEQIPQQMHDLFFLYLTQCIQFPVIEKSEPFQAFLEISPINHQGHKKFKECFMVKKAGGRSNESRCVRCGVFWGRWNKRYFCITSDGVSISKGRQQNKCEIREMIMFDYDFSVDYGMQDTGYSKGIRLNSSNRKLTLEATTLFEFLDFLMSLKEAIEESPYLGTHRFASFSPLRQKNHCKWYVDGENYFKDVYKYIKKAQHEIFITDWWLSPQFYLVRPVESEKQMSRLDLLLKQKASEKVKIFIVVYREPKVALTIDSHYTKHNLMGMHQNIKVLRHPKTLIPFMWSHHEKMVVIDQKVGFLGGLDICYGRMDNQHHHLFDVVEEQGKGKFWPGIDFSNGRTKDYSNVKEYLRSEIDRNKDPRLPWHDIAMRVVGDGVIDMSRHFIQYWNHALADLELKRAKDNQFVLRPRKNESQNEKSNDESGFLNKLKKQWKKFRESTIIEQDNKKSIVEEEQVNKQK